MISVGGKLITKIEELSDRFQQVLSLVPGSADWLSWAIRITSRPFTASGEVELAVQVQEGLHGTGIMTLQEQGVLVNVAVLMTLPQKDFESIIEGGEVEGILKTNQLEEGKAFLSDLRVRDNAIFQIMSLSDQIALNRLTGEFPKKEYADQKLQQEAAAFAVSRAQSMAEFISSYHFYMGVMIALEMTSKKSSDSKRKNSADERWGALLPYSYRLLESPSFGPGYSREGLMEGLQKAVKNGHHVGFANQATSLSNIMRFSEIKNEKGEVAREIIDRYFDKAQKFISSAAPFSNTFSQDGIYQVAAFQTADERAKVDVDIWGCATLDFYASGGWKIGSSPIPNGSKELENK